MEKNLVEKQSVTEHRLHFLASTKGANQARSFDIRETAGMAGPGERPPVSKSFSFGGYPAPHLASPQYRPAPPSIVKGQVVWAVSDVGLVPPGSVLINPDTVRQQGRDSREPGLTSDCLQGTPYLNSDGSVYMFDPGNPPRLDPSQDPGLTGELAKLSLDTDLPSNPPQPLLPPWVVPAASQALRVPAPQPAPAPGPPSHAPYILVNPHTSLTPHYLPYLSPQASPGPASHPHNPHNPHSSRPLLFSLHRSPPHLFLFLQHCPSLLTRAQLSAFLDSFLGPASPHLHGGCWQFLDQAGAWCDLNNIPADTATTNRFPIQIYFEHEDQANPTVAALKSLGFLPMEQNVD